MEVRYTLTVYVTQQIEDKEDPHAYLLNESRHDLERLIIRTLDKLDVDVDCEVMDAVLWPSISPEEHAEDTEREANS